MRRSALPALLVVVFTTVVATAAAVPDIGKFVPADAVAYLAIDGVDALEGAVGSFLENVMPGAGQIVDGMLLGRMPAIALVDRSRPAALWMLASGATGLVVPIRDPKAFERLAPQYLREGDRVTTIGGYGIVTRGGVVDIAALGAKPAAAVPTVGGQVRGFVEVGRLAETVHVGSVPPDVALLLGKVAQLPRVDFGLSASHERVELNATIPAVGDGLIATLARPPLPPVQNQLLDVLPADATMVFAASAPERMAVVSKQLFGPITTHLPASPKQRALARRVQRQGARWASLGRGDSATAVSMLRGAENASVVQAFTCTRPRHARLLLHKMTRHLIDGMPAMPVDVQYVPRAERIGDVVVDQLVTAARTPQAATPQVSAALGWFMREPVRYAFTRGAGVTTYGAGGFERMRAALTGIQGGMVAPAIARAVPVGALVALAVRPGALAAGGAIGDDYASVAVVPRGTALEARLVVPAGALPREGLPGFRR